MAGRHHKLEDYILGPKVDTCTTYILNEVKLSITWDHCPVYATIQEDYGHGYFAQQKKKKGWAGWRPSTEDAKLDSKEESDGTKRRRKQKQSGGDSQTCRRCGKFAWPHYKIIKAKEAKKKHEITQREKAEARCSRSMERNVLKMQASKAREVHAVKGSLLLGRGKPKRKPWT